MFLADGSQGQDLMKLSSSSDYFLIKGVSDGGNDYIHECMFISAGGKKKHKTTNTLMTNTETVIIPHFRLPPSWELEQFDKTN